MTPTEPTVTPIDWPTDDHTWWWMYWRPTPRSRWYTAIIETLIVDFAKCVKLHDGDNCLNRASCQGWEAQFVPATPPPKAWR